MGNESREEKEELARKRGGARVLEPGETFGAPKELFGEADVAAHATDGRVIDHGRSLWELERTQLKR